MLYLSQYVLSLSESRTLRLTDTYSVHRIVYGLFEDVRKGTQDHSGLLFADKGGDARERRLLILSNREPCVPELGVLTTKSLPDSYLQHPAYRFEIVINPVKKENKSSTLIPIRGREAIAEWFCTKAPSWGFSVHEASLLVANIYVDTFTKQNHEVTISKAVLTGFLTVTDTEAFCHALTHGIGRARSFGCGLLQIVPSNQ